MITKLTSTEKRVISNNNGMKMYLSSLARGRQFTPRSWLYEDRSPESVRDEWLEHLSKLEHGSSQEAKVFQFDTSQLEKWGPQGGIAPIQELLDDIVLPTFSNHVSPVVEDTFKSSAWNEAVAAVAAKLPRKTLRPASYKTVVDDMRARDTLESNSGWPDFRRRNLPEIKTAAIAAAQNGEWREFPAIALFRNYNQKTRLVWMFPMATNLVEGAYYQPLQRMLLMQEDPFFAPWVGFEAVRDLVTSAYDSGKFVTATDFSKTDEHFTLAATMQCFKVLEHCFQEQASAGLLESLNRMHNIPLVIGLTRQVTGEHGVASGSNWTNFIETVFDKILAHYALLQLGTVKGFYAIGDDMTWISDRYDEDLASKLAEIGVEVGQDINASKASNDPDSVKTLQRLFQRGYRRQDGKLRGVYSTIRALKSSLYPERFHNPRSWNSDMFCARQYMILENCVDHPLFEEFVKFVVKGQKDLIPFAKKTASDLQRIHRESKLLPGLNPTYNQERRDRSFADFESVRLVRSL